MSTRAGLLATGALLLLTGCTDPAGPAVPLTIRLDGPATVASSVPSDQGVKCPMQFIATAHGVGHGRWTAVRFRWSDVETGDLLGSSHWDEAGAQGFWAAEGISAGETLTSKAGATGGPHDFILDVTFELTLDDSPHPHTATHTFACVSR